jgi:alpha-1,2-rhamnosyltransferase
LLPSPGHLGIFKSIYKRRVARAFRQAAIRSTQVQIDDGDILWLPDAYWATAEIWPAITLAKRAGALVATLVYDLIPLQDENTGQIVLEQNRHFYHYLDSVVRCSDIIVTISETIRQQLEELIDSKWPSPLVCRDVRAIPLGAEIKSVTGPVRTSFTDFFEKDGSIPPYLCVGTFEPRKNQGFVLDAFEELWKSSSDLRLCMIGRVGWQCDKILDRLRCHPELGHRLLVSHTATDAEVNFSYRNCRALITASKSEGFGLPIVEALWHGRPVLASDIPVHREVGKTACHYFPLGDPEVLCQAVVELEKRLSSARLEITRARPIEWSDSWASCRAELIHAHLRKRDRIVQVSLTKP